MDGHPPDYAEIDAVLAEHILFLRTLTEIACTTCLCPPGYRGEHHFPGCLAGHPAVALAKAVLRTPRKVQNDPQAGSASS